MVGYIVYFSTEAYALAASPGNTSSGYLGTTSSGPLIAAGGFTAWKIASSSFGPDNQALIYHVGDTLTINPSPPPSYYYYLYPVITCFLEGSKILCNVNSVDTYLPVEELRKGTLVKTKLSGYKAVELIGKSTIQNPGDDSRIESRLYKCSPANYPDLTDDLYLTGAHSILVPTITDEQREQINKNLGRAFVTERMNRLPAWIDSRSEPWNSEGQYTVWHFALENSDLKMNYGVYANGLLVESCSIHSMNNKSNMTML